MDIKLFFEEEVRVIEREEQRYLERKTRRRADALLSLFKSLVPSIKKEDSFEDVQARIQGSLELDNLSATEGLEVYDKYMARIVTILLI